jgi:Heterokaryon incompatibility protein (HET)
MGTLSQDPYRYESLPAPTSFRVLELLPGKTDESISCLLHQVDWSNLRDYEAISYAWGDPNAKAPINLHGKIVEVTENLHAGLLHLRYEDRSRFLWADALWWVDTVSPVRAHFSQPYL